MLRYSLFENCRSREQITEMESRFCLICSVNIILFTFKKDSKIWFNTVNQGNCYNMLLTIKQKRIDRIDIILLSFTCAMMTLWQLNNKLISNVSLNITMRINHRLSINTKWKAIFKAFALLLYLIFQSAKNRLISSVRIYQCEEEICRNWLFFLSCD